MKNFKILINIEKYQNFAKNRKISIFFPKNQKISKFCQKIKNFQNFVKFLLVSYKSVNLGQKISELANNN